MNFVVRSTSIAAAVLLMLVSPAHAQSSAGDIVKSAKSGNWYVRITTTDQRTFEGRVTLIDRDTVLLTRTSVAIPDIAALDRRVRVGGGAVPGAAAGAAAMGFLGYGVVSGLCESSNCDAKAIAGLAGGAAMGATVGAVLGALLAPGRVEWRRFLFR